jgi:hypothetical protein
MSTYHEQLQDIIHHFTYSELTDFSDCVKKSIKEEMISPRPILNGVEPDTAKKFFKHGLLSTVEYSYINDDGVKTETWGFFFTALGYYLLDVLGAMEQWIDATQDNKHKSEHDIQLVRDTLAELSPAMLDALSHMRTSPVIISSHQGTGFSAPVMLMKSFNGNTMNALVERGLLDIVQVEYSWDGVTGWYTVYQPTKLGYMVLESKKILSHWVHKRLPLPSGGQEWNTYGDREANNEQI